LSLDQPNYAFAPIRFSPIRAVLGWTAGGGCLYVVVMEGR